MTYQAIPCHAMLTTTTTEHRAGKKGKKKGKGDDACGCCSSDVVVDNQSLFLSFSLFSPLTLPPSLPSFVSSLSCLSLPGRVTGMVLIPDAHTQTLKKSVNPGEKARERKGTWDLRKGAKRGE